MSTSPRIDAVLGRLVEQGRELSERSCPQALVDEARRIEVELGQANARIKRLESGIELLRHEHDPFEQEKIYRQTMEEKP